MRKFFLVTIVALGVFALSSCVKDGDFDALSHNIEIRGELHPSLGLPIGTSSMNMRDLLGKWQPTLCHPYFDPESNLLTFQYDSSFAAKIDFATSKGRRYTKSRKSEQWDEATFTIDQQLNGNMEVDLFNNITTLNTLDFDDVFASLSADVKAHGQNINASVLEQYNVKVIFDSIKLTINGTAGSATIPVTDSFSIQQLMSGEHISFLDKTDFTNYLNLKPTNLGYVMRMRITFQASSLGGLDINTFINQNLHIDSISTRTNISANFPLRIAGTLEYNMEMDLPLNEVDSALSEIRNKIDFGDSSYLALRFLNTIPLKFVMNDTLIDRNGAVVKHNGVPAHLYNGGEIVSAIVKDTIINGITYKISDRTRPQETILKIPINESNLDDILKTEKMLLGINISTAPVSSGDTHISIRMEDVLKSSFYIVINPENQHFQTK